VFVLHSVETHCMCIAQYGDVMCVHCTVKRGTVCVMQSVERYCVCTAPCRMVLCVSCTV